MGNVFDEMEKLNNPASSGSGVTSTVAGVGDIQTGSAGERYSTPDPNSETKPRQRGITVSRHHASVSPRVPSSHRDTTVSAGTKGLIDQLRKAVREIGKEAATHRFTVAEKRALTDLVYVYHQQGIRTSENEVARIAINFILSDYAAAGKDSILDTVIHKLNE